MAIALLADLDCIGRELQQCRENAQPLPDSSYERRVAMTWVIGGALPAPDEWHAAALPADVRMTVTNRKTREGLYLDNLLKIHAISAKMQMGFAGDVELGFLFRDALQCRSVLDRIVRRQPGERRESRSASAD